MADPLGLDDLKKFLGEIKDATAETVKKITDTFKDGGGAVVEYGLALKDLAGVIGSFNNSSTSIITGLNKQVAINKSLNAQYKSLIENSLYLEKRNSQINKSFGVGVKQAALLSQQFQKVATTLGISGMQAAKYGGSLKKMLPTLNQANAAGKDFYTGLQQTQHILQTNLGLTEDQANAYTQYAEQNGKSSSSMLMATKALSDTLDPSGTMGYFKMITEEIAGLSEDLQMQYGKIPGNLELAVVKAKKLGFTLEDLAGTADNLLDIESSIGQELEYQLLSGHRLVDSQGASLTNLYREAALRGDMNKQADIMNNILETEGETIENNMFARKQLAATLGIEEKQLASALQKKKILDKAAAAGVEIDLEGTGALEAAADAVKAGAISPEDFEALKEASDTRTSDERLDDILKVSEEQAMIDVLLLEQATLANQNQKYILDQGKKFGAELPKFTSAQLEVLGSTDIAKQMKTMLETTATSAKDQLKNAAELQDESVVTGTTVPSKKIGDAVIPPGYGSRILSFPEDTLQAPIAFNDNDTIVAGTNLAGGKTNSGPDMAQFAAMIVAAINNQTRALQSNSTFSGGINAPYYG